MDITITYRKTSRMSLRIGVKGDVRVSAPLATPQADVESFVNQNRQWIDKARQRMALRVAKRNAFFDQLPLSTRQECQEATDRLNAIIPPLVKKYAAQMGVKPAGISYKATISRWGSCVPATKRLMFSAYLLLLPEWCIESVVVHELTHLLVANHSPRFYAVMARYFPRWQEAHDEIARIKALPV